MCFNVLSGKLEETHAFSPEKLSSLRNDLKLKQLDAQMFLETEKLKIRTEEESASHNIEEIKRSMEIDLESLRHSNRNMRQRNEVLRAMNSHIDLVNEQLEEMHRGKSKLSAAPEEWEQQLGPQAVANLLKSGVLTKSTVKVRDADSDSVERVELSVVSNFSKATGELKRTNDSMKESIQRLQLELTDYKDKWAHNAGLFDKITDVLKDELAQRESMKPEGGVEDEEDAEDEEEEEEEEDEDKEDDDDDDDDVGTDDMDSDQNSGDDVSERDTKI